MKTLRKWDHKAHELLPMFQKLLRGSAYTSLEVHNQFGLGYPVCEECYQKEWERERAARMEEEAIRNGK